MLTDLVSTRARKKTYERASVAVAITTSARTVNRVSAVIPATNLQLHDLSQLAGSSASAGVLQAPSCTAMNVCCIAYNTLPSPAIAQYPLERGVDGQYKWVQPLGDGVTYEVNYFNSDLKRIIPLGRYTDPATASLAHSLARNRLDCRASNFKAQDIIQNMFDASLVDSTNNVVPMPHMPDLPADSPKPMTTDDLLLGHDIEDLLKELC